jgi:anti-sigma factor RsiW
MKCPLEVRDTAGCLLEYTSGKLDAERRARIEEHMAACPACHGFAGRQQAVWQALEAWEPAPVSVDFDRRLYQRIEQEVSWWSRLLRPFDPLFRHAVPVAAAAGVVFVAGMLLQRPAGKPAAPAEESAQVLETLQPDQVEHALDDMEMVRDFSSLVKAGNAESKM